MKIEDHKINSSFLTIWVFCFFTFFLLTSCSPSQNEDNSVDKEVNQFCEVEKFSTIKKGEEQGNLISWSNDGKYLAYIALSESSFWHIGDLYIVEAPDYSDPVYIDRRVVGGVIWSPDNSKVAYTNLRDVDNIYTITVYNIQTNHKTDLFPGSNAKTDKWSAPKKAVNWINNNTLSIEAVCGVGCAETIRANTDTNAQNIESQIYKKSIWETVDKEEKSNAVSSSGNYSAYIDDFGKVFINSETFSQAMVINPEQSSYININETWTYELKWSSEDNLAVRMDTDLTIYNLSCADNNQ